ncbi:hypothetical protein BAXH7_00977 [Bacillus amyloliquefaciens XH7]|jgi:hypothetical protein|nr:hypothetical protein BAXH7_00977 [Bacillus amyloliquefaciens XH7]KYC92694.1 hypothetical protein B425_1026 [Bacillus amyloliquefaciens]
MQFTSETIRRSGKKMDRFRKSDPVRLANVSCPYNNKQNEQYYEQRKTV